MAQETKSQVGLVGLGTMGSALGEALVRNDFDVRAVEPIAGSESVVPNGVVHEPNFAAMADSLMPPRRVLLMVTAGDPVDSVIEQLFSHLEPGDIVIDGGNSNFIDTERRSAHLMEAGMNLVGTGISGGEEGARNGAAVMAGGTEEGYSGSRDILQAIAAKNDGDVCCAHVGPGGAGHFVKMVHNGIEYGLMQAIGEAHFLLHHGLHLTHAECGEIFRFWNEGPLKSFLLEITADILCRVDNDFGGPLIDIVDDAADQTGTGRWMVSEAMALGVPTPTIAEAVAARSLSGGQEARQAIGNVAPEVSEDMALSVNDIRDALLATFLCCYAQGFSVLAAGADKYKWPRKEVEIARVWQNGCIIRADILQTIRQAFIERSDLPHLFANDALANLVGEATQGWRTAVSSAVSVALPVPAMASALTYTDALKTDRLWTALTQAQRDAFGAHTYRRTDRNGSFHSDWSKGNAAPD
ncbi:MAG: NADP-dependent phosphogluconate dehydrogenase [Alphaproteobacteria bacterium]|nr:NADP-dependent phosphogluconate dehydrogenase [Alphaproteobacteria bacterium]